MRAATSGSLGDSYERNEGASSFERWFCGLPLLDQWEYVLKLMRGCLPLAYSALLYTHYGRGACWRVEDMLDALVHAARAEAALRRLSSELRGCAEKRGVLRAGRSRRCLYFARKLDFAARVLGLFEGSVKRAVLVAVEAGEGTLCEDENRRLRPVKG